MMTKFKLIVSILAELKRRRLTAEVRRKKVFKMITTKRKLLKHKMLLIFATICSTVLLYPKAVISN
jgi:hypothetical protein